MPYQILVLSLFYELVMVMQCFTRPYPTQPLYGFYIGNDKRCHDANHVENLDLSV